MPNYNNVTLIGHLTRDPEVKQFASGGAVAKFGFAVNNSYKKGGEWVDEPVFVDVEVFNRGEHGKLADVVGDRYRKGDAALVVGTLKMDQWDDKSTGQKRTKLYIVADRVQQLGGRDRAPAEDSPRVPSSSSSSSPGRDPIPF